MPPTAPTTENDQQWMQRALELAAHGTALASPNPVVGCVLLTAAGELAGEGWHEYDRHDHAEIAALKAAGRQLPGGTAYVTLEPCNHTGRTGPCTEALIAAGIRRFVVATLDPNPLVAGKGVERLRQAGLDVSVGVLECEAQRMNEGFARWIVDRRPLVRMKVAMTLDGRIAPPPGHPTPQQPYWITGQASRTEVQRLRWQADAVLTGVDTVLADDPLLTDRSGLTRRRPLVRVVLDSALRTPLEAKLVTTAANDVVVFTVKPSTITAQNKIDALRQRGVRVEILQTEGSETGRVPLPQVLQKLGTEEILTLLTETGTRLNTALLEGGMVDRIHLFCAPQIMGSDAVPAFKGLSSAVKFEQMEIKRYEDDVEFCSLLKDPWKENLRQDF